MELLIAFFIFSTAYAAYFWLIAPKVDTIADELHAPSPSEQLIQAADTAMYMFDKHMYFQSAEWNAKRLEVLKASDGTCQMCGAKSHLHVHHITYANLGAEPLTDLATVCQSCHTLIHQVYGFPQTQADYETFYGPLVTTKLKA